MSHKKIGPDRISRSDVHWTQTNKQTGGHPDRQTKFIYRFFLVNCLISMKRLSSANVIIWNFWDIFHIFFDNTTTSFILFQHLYKIQNWCILVFKSFFPFQDPNPSKRGSWTKHDWFYCNSSAVEIKLNNPSNSICLSKTRELIEPAVTSSALSFISSNL